MLCVSDARASNAPRWEYQEACELNFKATGRKVSKQAFAILPKIMEVDKYLREHPDAVRRIIEVHPEVSFALWNGDVPLAVSKRRSEGKALREKLVAKVWPNAAEALRQGLAGEDFQRDDLLDAFAALWSVKRWAAKRSTPFGDQSYTDEKGFPMVIYA